MAIIKWRESYNTGVKKIDKQHQQLVALIEMMHIAIRDGATLEKVGEALVKISDYTTEHFATEENFMEEYAYPDAEIHINEHNKLKAEAERFSTKLAENFPDGLPEFYKFLREWLITHILEEDKKLGEFLKRPNASR